MKQIFVFVAAFLYCIVTVNAQNSSFSNISGFETDADLVIFDLNNYFPQLEKNGVFTFEIETNSVPTVAIVCTTDDKIIIDFLSPGQTNVVVKATTNTEFAIDSFVIGVLPHISGEFDIVDFENLTLNSESHWNGSDGTAFFISGLASFSNTYDTNFNTWSGWAYSNSTDNINPTYTNQYSAIASGDVDALSSEGSNFAIAYLPLDWTNYETKPVELNFINELSRFVAGVFVTNSTYSALTMEFGDAFTNKFGGETGNDPDWLKLTIYGIYEGIQTAQVEFYLADFRFMDNSLDYIIKTWQWIDLSALGRVDKLVFNLTSSDTGEWGMNTPAYFCIDKLCIVPDEAPIVSINSQYSEKVSQSPFTIVIEFSEPVFDFELVDIQVTNGTANNLQEISTGTIWNVDITPETFGNVSIDIAAAVAKDIGNNVSEAASQFNINYIDNSNITDNFIVDIKIYQNPTSEIITLKLNNNSNRVIQMLICDMYGRVVWQNQSNETQIKQQINLKSNSKGFYLIYITDGYSDYSEKIILR